MSFLNEISESFAIRKYNEQPKLLTQMIERLLAREDDEDGRRLAVTFHCLLTGKSNCCRLPSQCITINPTDTAACREAVSAAKPERRVQ